MNFSICPLPGSNPAPNNATFDSNRSAWYLIHSPDPALSLHMPRNRYLPFSFSLIWNVNGTVDSRFDLWFKWRAARAQTRSMMSTAGVSIVCCLLLLLVGRSWPTRASARGPQICIIVSKFPLTNLWRATSGFCLIYGGRNEGLSAQRGR